MNNYRIIDMSNDKYDAAGIRLSSGKNCIYFKNKDKDYDRIIIGRDYNVDINDGEVALVFKKDDTKEDIINLVSVFINALDIDINVISFGCNVTNEKEEEEMLEVSNMLGINFFINRNEKYSQFLKQKEEAIKREQELKRIEEEKTLNQSMKSLEIADDVKEMGVERQADDFFKLDSDVALKEENKRESLSDVFIHDWEQTKEESLFFQKEIEPKIYEKPIKKKKKSKLVIVLVFISIILLIGAVILFVIGN